MRSIVLFAFLLAGNLQSQNCTIKLNGQVLDEHDHSPLEYANVYIEETETGTAADEEGRFSISDLCPGKYHFRISHLSCESVTLFYIIQKDTAMMFNLEHHHEMLEEVLIESSNEKGQKTTSRYNVTGEVLRELGGKSISEIAGSVPGVSLLKSGPGISKPLIQGLFGNRVAILNNGVNQEGQQWGNDHAPEIDPFVASKVGVIKGAPAIKYGPSAMGGVVIVEPEGLPTDPHVHGSVQSVFQSNGRSASGNLTLEKGFSQFGVRLISTLKYGGDQSTPDYLLTNTGLREKNFAIQIGKNTVSKTPMQLYYSYFHTEIGILRGSHIGNLSDLETAFTKVVPFYTSDTFQYIFASPKQQVGHHLLKFQTKHFFDENKYLDFVLAYQNNARSEFDVRRGGRSDIPALDLALNVMSTDLSYNINGRTTDLYFGVQYKLADNKNVPGTGIIPLIPNYRMNNPAIYSIYRINKGSRTLEFGARYDLQYLNTAGISLSNALVKSHHVFQSLALSAGLSHQIYSNIENKIDLSYVNRPPQINELYSQGLHQGVSGIEEGDPNLHSEKSLKLSDEMKLSLGKSNSIIVSGFSHYIKDFIFLNPENEYRLTIRGAFPLFKYKQTDALLFGADVLARFQPAKTMELSTKISLTKGENLTDSKALVRIPAFNYSAKVEKVFTRVLIGNELKLMVEGNYTSRKKDVPEEEDFLPPPPGYFLANAAIHLKINVFKKECNFSLQGENIFDTVYRDYLNRLRYFANDTGRNILLNMKLKF